MIIEDRELQILRAIVEAYDANQDPHNSALQITREQGLNEEESLISLRRLWDFELIEAKPLRGDDRLIGLHVVRPLQKAWQLLASLEQSPPQPKPPIGF